MKPLVVFGAGGLARELLQIVRDINAVAETWDFLGFLDGNPEIVGEQIQGYPVLGGASWIEGKPRIQVSVGIGAAPAKRNVARQVESAGGRFATLIHPRAWIGQFVSIGEGTIVCAGVMVTTDVRIGKHVIVNLGCTIGHDVSVGDYVTIAPSVNVSGSVSIGEGCDLGTNATIIQGKSIGAWSIVGAAAAVVDDLPANVTAVGVPARPIKMRPAGWHLGEGQAGS